MPTPPKAGPGVIAYILMGIALLILIGLLVLRRSEKPEPEKTGQAIYPLSQSGHEEYVVR